MYNKYTFDDQVALVAVTITQDDYANQVETEIDTIVWADIKSATRNIFYNPMRTGLKPTIIVTVKIFEYSEQKYLKFNSKRYAIERTYTEDKENLELTCSEVTG